MLGGYGHGYGRVAEMGLRHGAGAAGPLVGGLLTLAVVAGIVLFIVLLVKASSGHRVHAHGTLAGSPDSVSEAVPSQEVTAPGKFDEALEIARRRFAAGEITKQQFKEIRELLG